MATVEKSCKSNTNMQHVCNVCNRLLTSPYKLREHMMIHTGEKPHACKVCTQAFRTKPDLARHMRIHTGERPYSCKLCGQRFHRSDNLRGHMKVHKDKDTEGLPYTSHIVRHSGGRKSAKKLKDVEKKAQVVDEPIVEKMSIEVQSNNSEEENMQPLDLQKMPSDKNGVIAYNFSCGECDSTFYQKGALAMHMRLVHKKDSSRSGSPVPSLSSERSPSPELDEGFVVNSSSTVYLCRFCGSSFEDLVSLEKHTATVHENNPPVDLNKNHTGVDENMNQSNGWTMEIDSESESPYDDDIMIINEDMQPNGRPTMDNGLTDFSPSSSDEQSKYGDLKSFACEVCPQKFAWKQDLNRHNVMVHTGQVPYRCTACGKGFLRQDRLIAHIRVHTGKSPHTCDHCHKSFTASSSLKEHMKIHTGEKPHHCYLCGKDFRQKCVLTRHVRNVHKVSLEMATTPPDMLKGDVDLKTNHAIIPKEEVPEAIDFSSNSFAGEMNGSDDINGSDGHVEDLSRPNGGGIHVLNTPVLLEHLNKSRTQGFKSSSSSSTSEPYNPLKPSSPTASNDLDSMIKKSHSCAACNTKFSTMEELSTHLMAHHVIKFQGNPVQQNIAPITPKSNIPNVVIQQDGGSSHEAFRINGYKPFLNGFVTTPVLNGHSPEQASPSKHQKIPVSASVNMSPPKCPLKCSLCGLVFTTQEELGEHTDSHIKSNPFFCGLCSDTFKNTTDLEDHIQTHSDTIANIQDLNDSDAGDSSAESNITCGVCREQLDEESELAEHMKMHCPSSQQGGSGYSCTLCDENFQKAEQMNSHYNNQHHCSSPSSEYSNLRLFGCNFCFRPFKTVRTLVLHLKSHLMEKPHQCEMCGKSFSLPAYLKQHVRTHTGERPYCCTVCNRRFSQKTQLTLHERQHRGETPFKCDTCGKAFTNKSVLKLHLTTHLPLPPFKCNICSRRFTQAGNVRRHIVMVHKDVQVTINEPMYTCDLEVNQMPVEEKVTEEDEEQQHQQQQEQQQQQQQQKPLGNELQMDKLTSEEPEASEEGANVTFPLDLTKSFSTVESGKNKGPEFKNDSVQGSKHSESESDDLLIMGAYYQQQNRRSESPVDFSLKKSNSTDGATSVGDNELSSADHATPKKRAAEEVSPIDNTPGKKVKPNQVIEQGDDEMYDDPKSGKRVEAIDLTDSPNTIEEEDGNDLGEDKSQDDRPECGDCVRGFEDPSDMSSHMTAQHGAEV